MATSCQGQSLFVPISVARNECAMLIDDLRIVNADVYV